MSRLRRTSQELSTKFRELTKNVFVRDVGVLAGGTGLAQALLILFLPILTRLYTPEDFSVLAVYAAVLGMLSVVACLRFEIAVPLPKDDAAAANLLALALASSAIVSGVVGTIVLLFPDQMVGLISQPALRPFLWLLPLGIWMASSYSALQYWATRKKRFSGIARTRVTQAIGGGGTQVLLGWAGATPLGLLFGHMISGGAGVISLGRDVLKRDRDALSSISFKRLRSAFRKYDRFPKFSTFDALANSAGIQLPLILIAAMAVGPEAGFLLLAMRIMQAPIGLMGGAVAQVYLSRAPDELRAGTLADSTTNVLIGLARVGAGPILFLGIFAPPIFSMIFGEEWRRAGELVTWMTPWFVFQLMSSPISMVMHVQGRQRAMLGVTVSGLILRLGAIALAVKYDQQRISEYYAISGAVFYFMCLWVFSRTAGLLLTKIVYVFGRAATPIISWVAFGICCRMLIERIGL